MLVVDAATFRDRGGDLAAKAAGVKTVFTLGPANYGIDLLQAIEAAGTRARAASPAPTTSRRLTTPAARRAIQGALRTHQRIWRLCRRDPRRLSKFRYAALPHGRSDQPRRGHKGAADADARRHRAYAEGVLTRKPYSNHRTRENQFHAIRADHDLRAAGSSRARQDRPLLARTVALRRIRDVAEPAGRGHRADRAGVLAALRPDRDAIRSSVLRKADHDPKTPGAVLVLRFPDRRLQRENPRRQRPGGRDRRSRRDLRARAACDDRILEAAGDRRRKRSKSGWLHTGDVARADERGLHVHPRSQEGHDRLRRLQHLSARGRGRAVAACRRSPWSPWSACPTTNGARRSRP